VDVDIENNVNGYQCGGDVDFSRNRS